MTTDDRVILHLVLTHHWYDEMVAGRKDVEYRAIKPHWTKMIWNRCGAITHVRFSRAYSSTTILRPVVGIDIGTCPDEGWDDDYYRINLGPIEEQES